MAKLSTARKAAPAAKKAAPPTTADEQVLEAGDVGSLTDTLGDPNDGTPAKKAASKKAAATAKKAAPPKAPPKVEKVDPLAASQPLSTVRESISLTYYGPQGTGKTSGLATMANLSKAPTYVINAEGGLKRRALEKLGIAVDRIQVLPAEGVDLTYTYLEDVWLSAKSRLEQDPESINGFGWDSVTEIHQVLLRDVVAVDVERAEIKGKDRDPFFIDVANYGTMGGQVTSLMRKFRDLPCHFAMTALDRRDKDKEGAVVYNPAVTPMLQQPILGWPDIVCATSVVEWQGYDEYRGLFRPVDMRQGKDRFKALPKRLIDPTFERIAAYVYDEMDINTDPVMIEARERRAKHTPAEVEEPTGDSGEE